MHLYALIFVVTKIRVGVEEGEGSKTNKL